MGNSSVRFEQVLANAVRVTVRVEHPFFVDRTQGRRDSGREHAVLRAGLQLDLRIIRVQRIEATHLAVAHRPDLLVQIHQSLLHLGEP